MGRSLLLGKRWSLRASRTVAQRRDDSRLEGAHARGTGVWRGCWCCWSSLVELSDRCFFLYDSSPVSSDLRNTRVFRRSK